MNSAKAFVKEHLHKAGQNDTTVHEVVAPAVVNENIEHRQHEEVITAVDKEVHQDHFHTSIQPIQDKQVLPEQHTDNVLAVEHRQFEHGEDQAAIEARLAREAAKFKDIQTHQTSATQSAAPIVGGEHVHHHVHENIQPVIHRETVEQHVVHTVVPVHETHINAAQHHSTSALPAVSMAEFEKSGGVLNGREDRTDAFKGIPAGYAGGEGSTSATTGESTLERAEDKLDGNRSGRGGTDGTTPVARTDDGTATKVSVLDKIKDKVTGHN